MKYGVFTVMLPDLTPEQAAQALKASAYDGVEWRVTRIPAARRGEEPSFWGNNLCTFAPTEAEARRARALAESVGLEMPGLGTYIQVGDLAATEEAMRFAQVAGVSQIRVGVAKPVAGKHYDQLFAESRAFLSEVEGLARRYRVKALVEIHHETITPSASLAYRLVSGFSPEWIGVIHDAGNMVFEGFENYRMGLELLGPYLAHVHIKNAAFYRPKGEGGGVWRAGWAPLEDGVVDFSQLLAALRSVGYDGWLVIEDFSQARPSCEALRHNLAFLKEMVAEGRESKDEEK